MSGATKLCNIHTLLADLRWDTLACRRRKHRLTLLYKIKHGLTPNYLAHMIPNQSHNSVETCSHVLLNCPLYVNQRYHHLNNIPCALTLNNLHYGDEHLTFEQNKNIFLCVQRYIASTNRFGAQTDYPMRRNLGCAMTLCYACELFL